MTAASGHNSMEKLEVVAFLRSYKWNNYSSVSVLRAIPRQSLDDTLHDYACKVVKIGAIFLPDETNSHSLLSPVGIVKKGNRYHLYRCLRFVVKLNDARNCHGPSG